jgi:hypothetical protein
VYTLSRRLAWVAGVVLPVGETLRRWGTWWVEPWAYLDDTAIGAFLLLAAWRCGRDAKKGQPLLAAAWGFSFSGGLSSLSSSITNIARADASGVSGPTAVAVKSLMIALGAVALIGAIRGPRAA